jgi:hypothetical protein
MNDATFSNLVCQVKTMKVGKVSIVGNGEPTLHPKFTVFVRELAEAKNFLSLTTNGQLLDSKCIHNILEAPVDMINVSVDGKDKEGYEQSRIGGNLEKLIRNLTELKEMKRESRSPALTVIRVAIRPSQCKMEQPLLDFWRPFGDVVSKQYIVDFTGAGGDTFKPLGREDVYPRCTLPSKQLDVRWNGDVPLCSYSQWQTGQPGGLLLGNIRTSSLLELRDGHLMMTYRAGHRRRETELMPLCKGCRYGS